MPKKITNRELENRFGISLGPQKKVLRFAFVATCKNCLCRKIGPLQKRPAKCAKDTGPLNNIALDKIRVWRGSKKGAPRVCCILYTHHKAHKHHPKAIKETWGRDCDHMLFASDVEDPLIGSVKIEHKGPEAYSNMWQKLRSIWEYVEKNLKEFDYYYAW